MVPISTPIQALTSLYGGWQQNPGSAPNGTGRTGLLPGDAAGWTNMLNSQVGAMRLAGLDPTIQSKNLTETHSGGPSNLGADPGWWAATGTGNVTMTPAGTGQAQAGGVGLPPSLQGLYKAGASTYKPNPPIGMPNSGVQ